MIAPVMTFLSRRVILDVQHEIVWERGDSAEGESCQKLRVKAVNAGGPSVTLEPLQVFLPGRRPGVSTMVSWRKLSDSSPARELRLRRRERAESEIDFGNAYADSEAPIKFTVKTQCGKEVNRTIRRNVEQEPSLVHTEDIDDFLKTPFVEVLSTADRIGMRCVGLWHQSHQNMLPAITWVNKDLYRAKMGANQKSFCIF